MSEDAADKDLKELPDALVNAPAYTDEPLVRCGCLFAVVLGVILLVLAMVLGPSFEPDEREYRDQQYERWEQERLGVD